MFYLFCECSENATSRIKSHDDNRCCSCLKKVCGVTLSKYITETLPKVDTAMGPSLFGTVRCDHNASELGCRQIYNVMMNHVEMKSKLETKMVSVRLSLRRWRVSCSSDCSCIRNLELRIGITDCIRLRSATYQLSIIGATRTANWVGTCIFCCQDLRQLDEVSRY